jgi:hypothetical protein
LSVLFQDRIEDYYKKGAIKMKSMIEKLGITPIERRYAGDYDESEGYIAVCRDEPVEELEKQRDEMLEALIETAEYLEDTGHIEGLIELLISIIEKATDKKWPEVKKLYETATGGL